MKELDEDNIYHDGRDICMNEKYQKEETETRAALAVSLFAFIFFTVISLLIIIYPELSPVISDFLKKLTEADISGIINELADRVKNVFV